MDSFFEEWYLFSRVYQQLLKTGGEVTVKIIPVYTIIQGLPVYNS